MSIIPFAEVRFFNPLETRYTLEKRFSEHLKKLRFARRSVPDGGHSANASDNTAFGRPDLLTDQDDVRIRRRASRVLDHREAVSGLSHLNKDDRRRLEVLRDGARLISILSEHHADELAAGIHAEMPWMAPASEAVWQAMRRSVREGWPGFRLPPLLLDGLPGIGKSHWARRLGYLLSVPTTVIEATGENASFSVVGSQRGWSGACSGRAIETVLQSRIANPVIVVDEVEKAGHAVSSKGQAFGLAEGLLPLLEPMTAKRWSCPYYQVKFDMSWVVWVLTSNNYRLLPEPLLSRCPPIRLRQLTRAELTAFVNREGARRGLSETAIGAICEMIAHPLMQQYHPSLRSADRMLRCAAILEHAPILH